MRVSGWVDMFGVHASKALLASFALRHFANVPMRTTVQHDNGESIVRHLRVSVPPLGLQNTFAPSRVSDIRQAMIAQQERIAAASERLVQSLMEAVFGYSPTIKPLKLFVARDANPPGGKTNVAKINGVQVGQQYVKVHSTRNPPPVWEVNSIHPGDFGITHAGLKNLDDPLQKKTVSFSALLDRTYYRLVSDVGAAA